MQGRCWRFAIVSTNLLMLVDVAVRRRGLGGPLTLHRLECHLSGGLSPQNINYLRVSTHLTTSLHYLPL